MLKKYKLSFEVWGLLLFLIIMIPMIPNFIWFAIPAPNNILRANSITETIDTVASVCQVLMIAALCIVRNQESKKLCVTPFIIVVIGCCLLYSKSISVNPEYKINFWFNKKLNKAKNWHLEVNFF